MDFEHDTLTLHFDPWLIAGSPRLAGCIDIVFTQLPSPGITPGRKPRQDATARRKRCVEAVITNLAFVALGPVPYNGLAVSLANRKVSRYDNAAFSTGVLHAVALGVEKLGFITHDPAVFKEKRTLLHPTDAFHELLRAHAVEFGDIDRGFGKETVELTVSRGDSPGKELVDYRDNEHTAMLHQQMGRLNAMLAQADLRFDGRPVPTTSLARRFHMPRAGEEFRFNRHGRLYGGFWQNLPRDKRHLLTIRGELIADLDYASMFVRLAYCRLGIEPPKGDLYAFPGLEGYRDAIKSALVSLFFRKKEAQRMSRGVHLPTGWTMKRFKAAAVELHPALKDLFDTDVGFDLMAAESDILVDLMLRLADQRVPTLPMHDGIMVPTSEKYFAMRMMGEVSAFHTGWPLPVTEKTIEQLY